MPVRALPIVLTPFLLLGAGTWLPGCSGESEPADLASFEAALESHDALERPLGMSRFLVTLGPENVGPAVEIMEANRVGVTDYEMRMFLFAWTRFDPAGAVEWGGVAPSLGACSPPPHPPRSAAIMKSAIAPRFECISLPSPGGFGV